MAISETNTREQFVAAAERLFADRGFYGASIAAIARELGLTKQALLHHFGSKEKLYGEVLAKISNELEASSHVIAEKTSDPSGQLEELVVAQYRKVMANEASARLLMRELLDNEQRAQQASNWYLKPYLDQLLETAAEIDTLEHLDRGSRLALVYQLLGAAHYFAVSQPTLEQIFGAALLQQATARYEDELRRLIRLRIATAN